LYFALDTAREARRLGVPFGRIADPVGRPVERGYSLLPWARDQGRGYEYCLSFLRGVWAHGVDAGSNAGLRRIVEAAGLSWSEARPHIGNDDWRAEAEANRREMFELGLWGVPCFRVGDVATWGQDRLWVIESELQRLAATSGIRAPA
jgi:2-hydroxychromene-2-carboxylate isomerase